MKLNFTGNWFIDLGILGFVNLMEEVYGWNLKQLKKAINQNENRVFYAFYPVAYFYSWLKDRKLSTGYIPDINEIEKVITDLDYFQVFEDIWWKFITPMFETLWINKKIDEALTREYDKKNKKWPDEFADLRGCASKLHKTINGFLKVYEKEVRKLLNRKKELKSISRNNIEKLMDLIDKGKVEVKLKQEIENIDREIKVLENKLKTVWSNIQQKVSEKNERFFRLPVDSSFFKNFMFYNINRGILGQKKDFFGIITFDIKDTNLQKIDKAINKFFPSFDEFSNEFFTKFSIKKFKEKLPKLFVYLLSFPKAFNRVGTTNISFYSDSIYFSYKVNKRVNLLSKNVGQDSSSRIFEITWQSILDTLWELKESWTLENMYLIQYRRLDNQIQEDVEYIGISKLQAEILADEKIREKLNIPVKITEKGNRSYVWLLEEFLKNKPLLPVFYKNLRLHFAGKLNSIPYSSLIYSAAIDKALKELGMEKRLLFSDEFFNRNKYAIQSITTVANIYFSTARTIREVFSEFSPEEKKLLAFRLFSRLIKNRKYRFVNELLKSLNQVNGDVERLIRYLFGEILQNDNTWQEYSIPIIVGLIKGGNENG